MMRDPTVGILLVGVIIAICLLILIRIDPMVKK